MDNSGYIYIIENTANDKCYVGQTADPTRREKQHFRQSSRGQTALKNAMSKYGKDCFSFTLLEKCNDPAALNEREIYWIKKLNSRSPHGYNMCEGGFGRGRILTKEHRQKLSVSKKGSLNPNFGKSEIVNNINWMRQNGIHPWKDKTHSEITKLKISETLKNKTHCKRGHEFTAENTAIIKRTGQRLCRECHRARGRKSYRNKQRGV